MRIRKGDPVARRQTACEDDVDIPRKFSLFNFAVFDLGGIARIHNMYSVSLKISFTSISS